MKKLICLLSALTLLVSLSVSAFAATSFVPSITYKDGPGLTTGTLDGEDVTDCLVITSIKQATDKTTDITQAERDHLLDVYAKLKAGTMKLPLDENYVIRELVDVSFRQDGIMQKLFHYGTLRLATVGDETTYTFKYSDISPDDLKAVSKLITDAKKRHKKIGD